MTRQRLRSVVTITVAWAAAAFAGCGPSGTARLSVTTPEEDAGPGKASIDAKRADGPGPSAQTDAAESPRQDTAGPADMAKTDVAVGGLDVAPAPDVAPLGPDAAPDLAPPPPPPVEIGKLTGLVLWLDSTKGVTADAGKITRWEDQSAAGNHATQNAAVGSRPETATEGGVQVVRFTRGQTDHLVIPDKASLRFGTADFAVFFVAANKGPIGQGAQNSWSALFSKSNSRTDLVWIAFNWPGDCPAGSACPNDTTRVGFGIHNTFDFQAPVSTKTGFNDGKTRLYVGRRTGLTIDLRINGAAEKSITHKSALNLDFADKPVYLGVFQPTGDRILPFEGDLREVVFVKNTIDDTELPRIEALLMEKHKITP